MEELRNSILCLLNVHFTLLVTIFSYGFGVDELALLSLQESYSLPVLMYAVPALSLKSKPIDELNVCWNNVIRRSFNIIINGSQLRLF